MADKHPQQEHQYRNSGVHDRQKGEKLSKAQDAKDVPPAADELWTREEAVAERKKRDGNATGAERQDKLDKAIRDQYDNEGTGSIYYDKQQEEATNQDADKAQ